jgi:hypothetical protein
VVALIEWVELPFRGWEEAAGCFALVTWAKGGRWRKLVEAAAVEGAARYSRSCLVRRNTHRRMRTPQTAIGGLQAVEAEADEILQELVAGLVDRQGREEGTLPRVEERWALESKLEWFHYPHTHLRRQAPEWIVWMGVEEELRECSVQALHPWAGFPLLTAWDHPFQGEPSW